MSHDTDVRRFLVAIHAKKGIFEIDEQITPRKKTPHPGSPDAALMTNESF